MYKYHCLRSSQSSWCSTTVFIYFPPSANTPRDTRLDSCKMHSACPACGAATDGDKTCGSCGAVRYLLLALFFPVFFTTFILQKYVVIVMKWEKEAVYFFNFKGEDELNEWKKKVCTLRSHSFYLSSSFSILAHVVPDSCTVYKELWRVRCFLQGQFCFSTYFLLSYLAELYSRVAPCNLGRRISSPHNMACGDG